MSIIKMRTDFQRVTREEEHLMKTFVLSFNELEEYSRFNLILIVTLTALVLAFSPALAANKMTDQEISDAIEDEISWDLAVPAHRIIVISTDGVVTLSGNVDNVLAKERAVRIAETVKGVRSVIDEIEVRPSLLLTDQQIKDTVIAALLANPATESYKIDVKVSDNSVNLSGTVDSWQEKRLAVKVAKGVRGVSSVQDNLLLDFKQQRSDAEIAKEIQNRMKWDVLVDHGLIDVQVESGNVTLRGIVGSAAEKQRAIHDAYVANVKDVTATKLKVERWARDEDLRKDKYTVKSDQEISQAVKDALIYDPRVKEYNISTRVENGTITLRGEVDSLAAIRAAADDARNTVGVVWVDNRLRVSPKTALDDRQLELKVSDAIERNTFIGEKEITVKVENGVARLEGTVDTFFEKAQAEEMASIIKGVLIVDNNLQVNQTYRPFLYEPHIYSRYPYGYRWYHYTPPLSVKSDARIKQDIKDELWWSPFVDAGDVNVAVDEGVATLTGTVQSWSESYAAMENAYEGGANRVYNNLDVKPQ